MSKLIECVPNFSEGRRQDVIGALVKEAKSVPGVLLLNTSSDPSHNRSVFTLTGEPEAIGEAAFRLCAAAAARIDLTAHTGEHPRMGATDVIPFVPVRNTDIAECAALSKQVAARIWAELKIPVFLYEESAGDERRRNLAQIRKGGFEGMPAKLLLPEWAPDFGERKVHPTAGVTAVGARKFLVAFNVNLGTSNIETAKAIAKAVRGSSGGYQCCKAIGVMLEDRNIAQVSMNMVDCDVTPLYRAFEAVRFEAARWGAPIIGTEIIGLTPMKALISAAEYYLKIENFDFDNQVFENHLLADKEAGDT